jgi:hypothetical protein
MSLEIPNQDLPVAVEAAVVRNLQRNRIGLEFLRFEANQRKRLQLFIRSELARRGLPRGTIEDIPTAAA